MKRSSPNHDFRLRVSKGIIDRTGEEDQRVDNGVTLERDGIVQFEKDLRAPTLGAVANDGTTVVIEGKNWDKAAEERTDNERFTTIYVYDRSGALQLEQNIDTRSVMACAIDGAGNRIAVGGINVAQVAIYDVATGEEIVTRCYDAIDIPTEITTVTNGDTWFFEITDETDGESTLIQVTTAGETVSAAVSESIDETELEDSQPEEADTDEPFEELLRDRGLPVPEAVYGLAYTNSNDADTQGRTEQLEALIERGPIYEPSWSDCTFVIPDTPIVLYVIGVDSVSDAATAFNRLCDMEQIDLSDWYQVRSTSGTAIPTPGDFERALQRVTPTVETNGITMGDNGVSISEEGIFNDIIRSKFYREPQTTETATDIGAPKTAFPESDFGEKLQATLRDGVPSESKYKRLVDDVASDEVVAAFPDLLDLLARGTVFGPYSIDLRSRKPSVQPVFNLVARHSPETVLETQPQLETHLGSRTSTTAPEVACRLLQTLVEAHPDRFEELVPMLQRLWEMQSAHPRRRVLDIVASALEHNDPDVAAVLDIERDSHVGYLIARMDTSGSAWLRYACCAVILATDLDETDYDHLEAEADVLIETLRIGWVESSPSGEDRRAELLGRGLHSPAQETSTDDELLDQIRSPEPSAFAVYHLHKRGVQKVLQLLAAERPEVILDHLAALMEDFTATGDRMEQVRKVAKNIVRTAVKNLSEKHYEELGPYDTAVLPLLESSDRHDIAFALEWAQRSATEDAIEALAAIHADPAHDWWQKATSVLEDVAPERVDDNREPNNARTRWTAYVSELAAAQGQLPASGDMRERSDTPEPPHWEVFDGWQDVLDSLDIETTYRTSNAPLRGRLIEDLQKVAQQVDGAPTTSDIEEYSEYTYTNFKNEFGGIRHAREVASVTVDHF